MATKQPKPRKPLPRISPKKLAANGGTIPFSTIAPTRKPMARGGKPKRKQRKPSEFARIYGSAERVQFVVSLKCVACAAMEARSPRIIPQSCGPIENAHIAGDGIGRKADYTKIVPLGRGHHEEQHTRGAGTFALKYQLDLRALAAATERAWNEHSTRNG